MTLYTLRNLNPMSGLLELQRQLDRFLQRPAGFDLGPSGSGVFPPLNVFSDADGLVVRAEVPGVDPASIDVSIERRRLTISGERLAAKQGQGSYHRRERRFGQFSRTIQLPDDLDPNQAQAKCHNGLLTVRVHKRAEARPRQVKIEA
jgi:HSP20 family protein